MSSRSELLLSAIVGLVLVILMSLAIPAFAYRDKMYPNTSIAGMDVSNLSYSQAKSVVEVESVKLANLPVSVVVNDPLKLPLSAKTTVRDLGISFQGEIALAQAWQPTHRLTMQWPRQVLRSLLGRTEVALQFTNQPQAVTNFITVSVDPLIAVPVPAMVRIAGDSVSIVSQSSGVTVDRGELTARLALALKTVTDGDPLTLLAPTHPSEPGITEASLRPLVLRLNEIGDSRIVLSGTGLSLNPSRSQILSWFLPFQDLQGAVSLKVDPTKVEAYLRAFPSVDLVASSTAIVRFLQERISASALGPSVRVALIMGAHAPVQAGAVKLGLYPGKYIQVNLAEQKLYQINGSNLEQVYRVSTGKSSTPTPTGTFTLNGHARRPLSSLYGLYMPYWINFKDGAYGMHELPEWPNGYKEGEGHLGVPVSDGCIRLGVGEAKEVYDWTPDGTPLLIQ